MTKQFTYEDSMVYAKAHRTTINDKAHDGDDNALRVIRAYHLTQASQDPIVKEIFRDSVLLYMKAYDRDDAAWEKYE